MKFQQIGALAIVAALPAAFAQPPDVPAPGSESTFFFRSGALSGTINGEQNIGYTSAIRIEGGLVKNAP
jgi:hypothetical protein